MTGIASARYGLALFLLMALFLQGILVVDAADEYRYAGQWGGFGMTEGLKGPWDVTVDAAGNVYVADMDRLEILKYDESGAYLTKWGWESVPD